MQEQTPHEVSFDERAAGAAAADDALLDLGQIDAPTAARAAAADDLVLDLGFDDELMLDEADEPAAAPQSNAYEEHPAASPWADAPSAFAEAAHGEQPRHFAEASPLDLHSPSAPESSTSFVMTDSTPHAQAVAHDEPWRDVVMQEGPQGFAFDAEPQGLGSAPRGFVEPEVVPADAPVPAVVESEFTDGSVEGDLPKAPSGRAASSFVESSPAFAPTQAAPEVTAAQQEPSAEGFAVGEARAGIEEPLRADQLSREAVDAIARRVVEMMSDKVVREIAWEVVPELAEILIKQRLEEKRQA